jgi:hypothetical protein
MPALCQYPSLAIGEGNHLYAAFEVDYRIP